MFDRRAAEELIRQARADANRWIDKGGEARGSHDGEQIQFVFVQGELEPELQAIKDRMDKWTPEQWNEVNEYLRKKEGFRALADAWYGGRKHSLS
jgi:hypothetical protein